MSFLNRFKVSQRLVVGFGAVLALMLTATAVGIWKMSAIAAVAEELATERWDEMRTAREMREALDEFALESASLALAEYLHFMRSYRVAR